MRRYRVISILLVSIFLYAVPATARMKFIPPWERMHCGLDPTAQFACYDFSKTQDIANVDLRLQLTLGTLKAVRQNLKDSELAGKKIRKINEILTNMNTRLMTRAKEKHVVLEENTLALAKAEDRSVWKNMSWIVATVVAVGAIAFAAGYYTDR